ncbi:YesL family protein [Enterococcus gallinarum]|uniref:DUF624 domain-containing protein n=1 Tax=Enterococcus gallinarum TaxID=1353 RepID=A0ABD4HL51_ENTGA|nr:DUF624 domain-containing protein [Enterococcus gallinarum]MBF0822541.1 DUF624 domain-containing protein [Enterococcus faecalis]MBA0947854.1 DUF624 domain-containing protein [Enterococcus gallinarum]MBA0960898.1 DUF624 domain-containing protein [Enterococcus gallinarum]MBA0968923.1 DUF624 domain-containing protein [Enterococcus gallinarum]MBA0972209.1 DUF624 domain-containing protein [Enterococcus gallinarum]
MKINQLAQYLDWIAKFAYLNILWLGFTFLGIGIFGFFPATMTCFIMLKGFVIEGETEWTVKQFFSCYKKVFFRSNGIGSICSLIIGSLVVNLQLVLTSEEPLFIGLRIPILLTIIGTIFMLVYVFPISVYGKRSLYQTFFSACCFALAFPVQTAKVLIFLILIAGIGFLFPMFLLFFSGSVSMYLVLKNYVLLQAKIEQQ